MQQSTLPALAPALSELDRASAVSPTDTDERNLRTEKRSRE